MARRTLTRTLALVALALTGTTLAAEPLVSVSRPLNITNAAGTGLWSEGDPFVGVKHVYWSATEAGAADAWFGWSTLAGVDFTTKDDDEPYVWPVR